MPHLSPLLTVSLTLPEWLDTVWVGRGIRIALLVAALPLLHLLTRAFLHSARRRLTEQSAMLIAKAFVYSGTVVIVLMVMRELNFKLTAILGAAGIAGVAIGFASQTSLSNLISGLFLIWEKPCQVGDLVTVDNATGLVHSIDLLSMKIRTFDNRFIRIPNETLLKSQLINVTRFPIRRMDMDIGVAYKEDIAKVMEVLTQVADRNPYCLDEPAPIIVFRGFGDSALEFLFGVWFAKADFLQLRNSIMREIKERFDAEGIEIPFPHRTLYAGAATEPFPVRVVEPAGTPTDDQA